MPASQSLSSGPQLRRCGARRASAVARCAAAAPPPAPHPAARWCATVAAAVAVAVAVASPVQPAAAAQEVVQLAGLGENPVKNARALLRNALPIKNRPIREAQAALESITEDLRVPGVRFQGVEASVRKALSVARDDAALLKDVAPAKRAAAAAAVEGLKRTLQDFQVLVANKDKQEVPLKQQEALAYVGEIEEAMVAGFPFDIPAEYASLPALKGRAEVELVFRVAPPGGAGPPTTERVRVVLDGYNAPLSAGNFLDLAQKGFYDGMDVQRADGFVVQSGDPAGPDIGYVVGGKVRTVPLEIMVQGDRAPLYGSTLEDVRRFREQPALPFNAFGTLAAARSEFDNDSASSQFFFLLKESELTPSGTNILDGRYAVFGYAVDGQEALRELKVGDKIEKVTTILGADNLVLPA